VQLQRADHLGIKISDEMLNSALTDVAGRNKMKFSDLPAALEQQGIDYRQYREEMRKEMTLSMLRQRDVYQRIYVSPREIEQCAAKIEGHAERQRRVRARAHPRLDPGVRDTGTDRRAHLEGTGHL
jgi:peptidyl-prolyl cis-trans isomerase SurA